MDATVDGLSDTLTVPAEKLCAIRDKCIQHLRASYFDGKDKDSKGLVTNFVAHYIGQLHNLEIDRED